MSLRLLTFTSEIVMNNRVMLPFNRLGYNGVEDHPGHREQLRADLGSMLSLRPLVSLGLIKFEPIQGMLPDSALWDEMQMASRLRPYYDAWIDLGLPIPTDPHGQFDFECTLAGATWYANKFGGTPLATNPVERLAWQAALEGKVNDTQIAKLQSLASLNLPDIRPNVASLAAIRSSSTAFSEWHLALSHSLGEVLPLGEDPLEVAKGTARFAAELRIALAAVEREISRSPALSAAQKGITSFSIAGLGASAAFALVTQQPWGALVGAAVTKTSETALEYVKARSELRQKRAIWDLVLAFDHDTRKRP